MSTSRIRFSEDTRDRIAFWLALLAGVAMLIAVAASCAHAPPQPDGALQAAGLERLYCVEHDKRGECSIYRSAQPTREQLATLVALYHIKSIVKLNTFIPFDGGPDRAPPGVELYHHPWAPAGPVDHEDASGALLDLATAPRPVLVHCLHGEDRTGLLIGLYRVSRGVSPFAAWGEMRAYGFHEVLVGLVWAFERETGWAVRSQP